MSFFRLLLPLLTLLPLPTTNTPTHYVAGKAVSKTQKALQTRLKATAHRKDYVAKLVKKAPKGQWVTTNESMSSKAAQYQSKITGKPAKLSYKTNGVKFDGMKNGTLIDAKSAGGYKNFVDKNTGKFFDWCKAKKELVKQAKRQLKAAKGVPIEWHFESEKVMKATQKLFKENEIHEIKLTYTP